MKVIDQIKKLISYVLVGRRPPDFIVPQKEEKVIIYSNPAYRGALIPDSVKNRKANAKFELIDLHLWEHCKSMNDALISRWVNERLVPELESKGELSPVVVWRNSANGRNYVIDGHHRILAYLTAGWKESIKAIELRPEEVILTDWTP